MHVVVAILGGVLICGCGFPHDASGTLSRVRGGVPRAGLANNPPRVIDGPAGPGGVEPALIEALAGELGATVQWTRALHDRSLDLVAGGFDTKVSWVQEA